MSVAVANRLVEELRAKPTALVGLAAGDSPQRAYELMVARARAEPALFARTRWIKLDEWGGLAMDDPAIKGGYDYAVEKAGTTQGWSL